MCIVGYGKTRKDVMHIAESVPREKGKNALVMVGGVNSLSAKEICHSEEVMLEWMLLTRTL